MFSSPSHTSVHGYFSRKGLLERAREAQRSSLFSSVGMSAFLHLFFHFYDRSTATRCQNTLSRGCYGRVPMQSSQYSHLWNRAVSMSSSSTRHSMLLFMDLLHYVWATHIGIVRTQSSSAARRNPV